MSHKYQKRLSNIVDNDVIFKKRLYDKWVNKVNAIDTGGFVLKTQYNIDESVLENNWWGWQENTWYYWTCLKTDYKEKIADI